MIKTGVTYGELVRQINAELDTKQKTLIAGNYISISEDGTISADYEPVSIYHLDFEPKDFVEEVLSIPAKNENVATGHDCGSTPILRYIQEYDPSNGTYSNVVVDYTVDASGNITIKANPFTGRLLIDSLYAKAANLENIVNDILNGSVD